MPTGGTRIFKVEFVKVNHRSGATHLCYFEGLLVPPQACVGSDADSKVGRRRALDEELDIFMN